MKKNVLKSILYVAIAIILLINLIMSFSLHIYNDIYGKIFDVLLGNNNMLIVDSWLSIFVELVVVPIGEICAIVIIAYEGMRDLSIGKKITDTIVKRNEIRKQKKIEKLQKELEQMKDGE